MYSKTKQENSSQLTSCTPTPGKFQKGLELRFQLEKLSCPSLSW